MRGMITAVRAGKKTAVLAVTGILALLVSTAAVAAVAGFEDVPDDHLFANEIAWLADNDITRGCNPPANDLFCPDDNVTRGQMAAFMYRFAQNVGTSGPVGPAGPAGQSLVHYLITDVHPIFTNARVVDVPAGTSSGPDSPADGVALVEEVVLQPGLYRIEGTVQFFDFTGVNTENVEYGVTRIFLGSEPLGSSWTADIPDDGNNAAQAYGAAIVEVAEPTTMSVRAIIRTTEATVGDNIAGHAGGNVIVTRIEVTE